MNYSHGNWHDSHARAEFYNRILTPDELFAVGNDPLLRWRDVTGGDVLLNAAAASQDPYLHDLTIEVIRDRYRNAQASLDPFWPNYPAPGELPPFTADRIPLGITPFGDVYSKPIYPFTNVLLAGPIGHGKTNQMRIISAGLAIQGAIVIIFDPKGDFADCATLWRPGFPFHVFDVEETPLALLQPPPGADINRFISNRAEMLRLHLSLQASKRLLLETLHLLFQRQRPPGTYPTLSEWLEMLERIRANSMSRLGQYREALSYALLQIKYSLGRVVDHASSNFFDVLFNRPGLYVIRTGGLMPDMANLYAGLFIEYIYETRGRSANIAAERPVIFEFDDAMNLLRGNDRSESEGSNFNIVSHWALTSRARKIHFIVAGQNFASLSPSFRNNVETIFCFGSWGRDAEELGRHLGLNPEQKQALSVIRPPHALLISRDVWPHPVMVQIPLVQ